jgi:hypothetical protein
MKLSRNGAWRAAYAANLIIQEIFPDMFIVQMCHRWMGI